MRKAFLEKAVLEPVYNFDEKLLRMFEKVSRSLKYDSNFFLVHKHYNTVRFVLYIFRDVTAMVKEAGAAKKKMSTTVPQRMLI